MCFKHRLECIHSNLVLPQEDSLCPCQFWAQTSKEPPNHFDLLFLQQKPQVSTDHLSEQRSWLLSSTTTQHRFVVKLRVCFFFVIYFINPKCPRGAFVLHYSCGSQCSFCVSAYGATVFKSVGALLPAERAVGLKKPTQRKCIGLPDRNFLVKLQNIANWSKHVVIVIKKYEIQKKTRVPISSADHHFNSACSASWEQQFLPPTLYIVTFRALCWLLSKRFWLKKAKTTLNWRMTGGVKMSVNYISVQTNPSKVVLCLSFPAHNWMGKFEETQKNKTC